MRTPEQISERIRSKEKDSFFGFDLEVLIYALDFEHAKPWLKPDSTAADWPPETERTEEGLRKLALDYLEFAWGKAEDHRGISASRSVQKMTEYCWLLGMDELVGRIEREEVPYRQYGTPILREISVALGHPVPTTPEMVRMMSGEPCTSDCDNGCAS